MKLLRLKITDPAGFRSLQTGFEHTFRTPWQYEEEAQQQTSFAPFICAGHNGSGKSNILEALASIFYHLESMYLDNLPDSFRYDEETNIRGFRGDIATPNAFEIEYLIKPKQSMTVKGFGDLAHVKVVKELNSSPKWFLLNHETHDDESTLEAGRTLGRQLLPDYVLGYSSGENEILSLPFFKSRFVQFDEYWAALEKQTDYSGTPESRLVYLDAGFSQAILLANLLFQNEKELKPFREEMGIEELKEFRIIVKRNVSLPLEKAELFGTSHPCVDMGPDTSLYTLNILHFLENDSSEESSRHIIDRFRRCASCSFEEESTDSLYLDFYVNDATRTVFKNNFSSALELFQAFQVLLTLNLYTVSDSLKKDLYQSDSPYVSETVPTLASDERIMRFKNVWLSKKNIKKRVLLKDLSDGEHQLLHTLGLCLLFKDTESLFLLDEPETHFNPHWRANFISRLEDCFQHTSQPEMLITTHTPFLVSDSERDKVMVFKKDRDTGKVSVSNPDYNTLGASINKITMSTFEKGETIGGRAYTKLKNFEHEFDHHEKDKRQLLREIDQQLGDSIEKMLLVKTILDSMEEGE
jgi:restriction system-associated AAA family ATPase